MSSHRPSGGYGHSVRYIGWGGWRMSWCWDRKIAGSRLRHPQEITRDTDLAGAKRFAAKYALAEPLPPENW